MKRILANIINNSVEAIGTKNGTIHIILKLEENQLILTVRDNGKGINGTSISSLFQRGFTTKKDGRGLGLYYARETLKEWGGQITLESRDANPTTATIMLPQDAPPLWFINCLSVNSLGTIVCIDDNISIWNCWKERFKQHSNKLELMYFANKEEFISRIASLKHRSITYLIDFEFVGTNYSGIDIINIILAFNNIKNRIFIVTSNYNDKTMQDYCDANSIHIIPKSFASKIPLTIYDEACNFVILASTQALKTAPDYIHNTSITYTSINQFISDLPYMQSQSIFIQGRLLNSHVQKELSNHRLTFKTFNCFSEILNLTVNDDVTT